MSSATRGSSHLPKPALSPLQPRKSPVQARSAASVEAILEATIQVLLSEGRPRLTTTKVALRAGVSIGTLYQYFPNKGSLLKAVLQAHLTTFAATLEAVCEQLRGRPLAAMAADLSAAYIEAKFKDPDAGRALYSVSDSVEGPEISRRMAKRIDHAIAVMLATASEPLTGDPQRIASTLRAAMAGVSRHVLESADPGGRLDSVRQELIVLASAYLEAHRRR